MDPLLRIRPLPQPKCSQVGSVTPCKESKWHCNGWWAVECTRQISISRIIQVQLLITPINPSFTRYARDFGKVFGPGPTRTVQGVPSRTMSPQKESQMPPDSS